MDNCIKILVIMGAALSLAACGKKSSPALVDPDNFKDTVDGKAVALYTIRNNSKTDPVVVQATNFGGRIVSINTLDKDGKFEDIVVGHDNLATYIDPHGGERFYGACVGPVANRIGGASFSIGDSVYHTPANDHGVNTLHGGYIGLDNVVWDVAACDDSSLTLHYVHPDGLEGYPGNVDITMKYSVSSEGEICIDYEAVTDKPTPFNITNHPFFNLRGEGNGLVEEYYMMIPASRFTPTDSLSIPTGELAEVEGTPFDFREPHLIGEMIGEDNQQLIYAHGYDHNFCLDKPAGEFGLVCDVWDPVSGRRIEVLSDQPGLQVYSGNFFNGAADGKTGRPMPFRSALALECQNYPDAINNPAFPDEVLMPGETYRQHTVYRFSAVKTLPFTETGGSQKQ